MTDNILVVGAGELGLAVLEALARHPKRNHTRITVLLRQATLDSAAPEKKKMTQRIKALGVHFEAADVLQVSSVELAVLFSKYDTVVSCTGMGLPSGTQKKLAEAALAANVRYFPWPFGMDYDEVGQGSSQDLFDEQLDVRAMLRGQDATEWVIISTGLFMSFLFVPEFGVVDLAARTVRALGSWDNRITVTTPEDIGRATAEVVLDPRGIRNQCVYVAGDTVSYEQLADLVDQNFAGDVDQNEEKQEKRFTRELWDLEELKRQRDEDPESSMVKYRDTFAQGKGVAWGMEKTLNAKRAMEMTDVKAYLERMEREV